MRAISISEVNSPVPPDTVSTLLLAAATAQAIDFAAESQLVRLTGMSSAGAQLNFYANLASTAAAIPSSGTTATTSTTGVSIPVLGTREFAIPSSTGFSVIAPTSGYIHVECWRR